MSRPIFYSVSIQIRPHCRRIKTETWLRPFMSNLMKMSIKKTLLRIRNNSITIFTQIAHRSCQCLSFHLRWLCYDCNIKYWKGNFNFKELQWKEAKKYGMIPGKTLIKGGLNCHWFLSWSAMKIFILNYFFEILMILSERGMLCLKINRKAHH